ncbi:hypothetical protein QBC33DRAFT_572703 [Phialemonium atrogriseum]|uniref:Uncharacterized protein n=1 Tax=Phialemonium atrogriseum TaxID=1093897 RepID=A0AAJ0FD78_9PEZI|nr:uncharacterized protein QBC33DRAFT_572703 [Phialemonium atrogriseum]KAK1764321.1 hypothetical protein QBC33DRAFT_572703 [Phialemonium atrogriseum]
MPDFKVFATLGKHPIAQQKRLDRLWHLVGVFRVGWSNVDCSSNRPVTLMVIVRTDAVVDARLAQGAATRCHEILLKRGLEDIAVEVA